MPPHVRSKSAIRGYVSLLAAAALLVGVDGIGVISAAADPETISFSDNESIKSDSSTLASKSASGPTFPDLDGNVHRDAVRWLAAGRMVQGHADGTFRPADRLTRGQLASLLVRALELDPASCTGPCARLTDLEPSVHAPSIRALVALGISTG